ncbi:unnamed protein product [Sympodiomycopsis kandeliae]
MPAASTSTSAARPRSGLSNVGGRTATSSAASANTTSRPAGRPASSLAARKPNNSVSTSVSNNSKATSTSRSQTSQGFHHSTKQQTKAPWNADERKKAPLRSTSTGSSAKTMHRTRSPPPPLPVMSADSASKNTRPRPLRGNEIFRRLKRDVFQSGNPSAMFPSAETPSTVDQILLHDRLVDLANSYLDAQTLELHSASLYSYLALTLFPDSIAARRCRAQALMAAGQGATFPFMPHRSLKAGAAAALTVLEQGPLSVFADVECARIWGQACQVLGRTKEAAEVLAWCLDTASDSAPCPSSSQLNAQSSPHTNSLPTLTTVEQRKKAIALTEMADLHKKARRLEQGRTQLLEARRLDPWNWRAWVALCEMGSAVLAHTAFVDRVAFHDPLAFLDSAIVSLGGDPNSLSDVSIAEDDVSVGQSKTSTIAPSNQAPGGEFGEQGGAEASRTNSSANRGHDSPTKTTSQHTRPGSRPIGAEPGKAAVKRTKSASVRGVASKAGSTGTRKADVSTAAAFGFDQDHGSQRRGAARSTNTTGTNAMTRTLSQARTNERPPSSSSSASRSDGGAEKEKELAQAQGVTDSVNVTKDSLRRSTRSQANTNPSNTTGAARRGANASSGNRAEATTIRGGTAAARGAASTRGAGSVARSRIAPQQTHRNGDATAAPRTKRPEQTSAQPKTNDTASSAGSSTMPRGPTTALQRDAEDAALDQVAESIRKATLARASAEAGKWTAVDSEVLKCLRMLGGAYKDAKEYKGDRVLRAFSSHLESGLSESVIRRLQESTELKLLCGRVHHDMAQYVEAEQCYASAMRSCADSLLADMDIYSLVLFHLARQEKLSALAQQLMNIDEDAAQTHLVVGNLFSLNASPSIALRSFRRACLAAPDYAHSYTLAGHEYRALNQPVKALSLFREALRVDARHWNGWSGIGMLMCAEGQWKSARTVLGQACSLNPSNAQLWDVFGIASEQMNDRQTALEGYTKATLLNPKNAGALIRKGELLWAMHRLEAAHNALLQAVALSPNEAQVHLRLAQSYMRKGGGTFAPLSISRPVGGEKVPDNTLSMAGKAKAMGESALPVRYHAEISRHLAIAVDLEPSLSRRVKALTEGVGATLRGQAIQAGNSMAHGQSAQAQIEVGVGYPADRSVGSSFSGVDQSRQYELEEYTYDSATGMMDEDGSAMDAAGRIPGNNDSYMDEDNHALAGSGGPATHAADDDSALAAEEMVGVIASGVFEDSMGVLRDEAEPEAPADEAEDEEDEEEEEDVSDLDPSGTDDDESGHSDEEDQEQEDVSADLVEASFARSRSFDPDQEEEEMSLE